MELRVLALYPDQMNIYADRGNILFLRRRCEWRGIGFEYRAAGPGEAVDPALYYMRTTPWFETGDARYAWLNRTVCVGSGERLASAVRIDFYAVK